MQLRSKSGLMQIVFCLVLVVSTMLQAAPTATVTKLADGVQFSFQAGTLRLAVMSNAIIRVTYAKGDSIPELKSYSVVCHAVDRYQMGRN